MDKLLFIALFFFSINTFSQDIEDSIYYNKEQSSTIIEKKWFVNEFIKDDAKVLASPFKIKKKNLNYLLPIASTLAISIAYDNDIRKGVRDLKAKNPYLKNFGSYAGQFGGSYALATVALIYLGGEISGRDYTARTGFMCIEALAHIGLSVSILKFLVARQRAYYNNGQNKWFQTPYLINNFSFSNVNHYSSFPSGHSAVAFSIASVIASRERHSKLIPILVYSAAAATVISRLTDDMHYASDVIAGSLIGFGIGKMVVNNNRKHKWTVFPTYFKNNVLISASSSF